MRKSYLYAILAALLLAGVAIFFFYPDVLEGRVLQQSDMQQGIANGHEAQEFEAQTGEKTRWTNALFSGMPNFQIAPSYTANSMLEWISGIYTLWLPSPANLLFGMMLGFFIMLLCMRFRWYTALLGAIGWGLSSYFVIIIGAGHIWKFLTLMYIPPTIGGIALCYRKKYLPGTALAALFGSLQLMSNHPQMTYYFLFVILALMTGWGIEAFRGKDFNSWVRATMCVLAAGILALAVNSASLYNTYRYSKETIRGKATELPAADGEVKSGADIGYITQWSYGTGETFSLLIPDVRGGASIKPNPNPGASSFKSAAEIPQVEDAYENGSLSPEEYQFIAQFPQYFGEQPMTNGPVYVGAILLLLALLAFFCVRGAMKWCLLAVSVLAVSLSWGHNFIWLTELFVNYFPVYNKFRTPASILVIVEFTVPLLAVMSLREILRDPEFFNKYRYQFYAVFGLGALICLAGWLSPSLLAGGNGLTSAEEEQLASMGLLSDSAGIAVISKITSARLSLVQADCGRSLIFIVIGFAILMLYMKGILRSRVAAVCSLAAVVLVDLFNVDRRYMDSDNFTDQELFAGEEIEMTPADREILRDKDYYRVLDADNFNGARSSYFHKTIGGYHAAKLTRYSDLITRQISKGNQNVLDMLNARYVIHGGKVEKRPSALGNAWFIDTLNYVNSPALEMDALDSLDPRTHAVAEESFRAVLGNQAAPADSTDFIRLVKYAPNRLEYNYRASAPRVAVFSEIYFPWGWKATVDGKEVPVARVDYVLRALRLPAGNHQVSFAFNPETLELTNGIGVAAVIVVYILLGAALVAVLVPFVRQGKKKERP